MRIEWSDHAVSDLKAISEYIERDRSLDTVNRDTRAIYEAIRNLQNMPLRGRHGRVGSTRELTVPRLPYLAIYEVIEHRVVILNIVHGARRWP